MNPNHPSAMIPEQNPAMDPSANFVATETSTPTPLESVDILLPARLWVDQALLVELLDSEQLIFPFRITNYNNYKYSIFIYAQVWPSPPPGFVVMIFAVVGTLPARGAVACELLTVSSEISEVYF